MPVPVTASDSESAWPVARVWACDLEPLAPAPPRPGMGLGRAGSFAPAQYPSHWHFNREGLREGSGLQGECNDRRFNLA